jgi:hypothetical protein
MLDTEIMRLYKEEIWKGVTEYNQQQNNQNEVVEYEERRKRNDWYEEECQIKAEEVTKPESKG